MGAALAWLPVAAGASDAALRALSDRLEALPDAAYIGGMGPDMQAIAADARQLAMKELGRQPKACSRFDPMRGTLVAEEETPRHAKPATLGVVRMFAGFLDSPRRVVSDTAAYALGEIGPDARAAFEGRTFASDTWTPWQAHAGSRVRCDLLSLGDAQRVLPPAVATAWLGARVAPAQRTTVEQATLVAERALRDPDLVWPDGLFADWLGDERVEPSDTVAPAAMRALGDVVADRRRTTRLREDVAYLLQSWGSQAAPAAAGLRIAMTDPDERLAYSAATALLKVGGEMGIEAAQWLLAHDASLDYFFRDLCGLGPASAVRLTPRYADALLSPNWKEAESAAELLACVGAHDAVDPLLVALDRPVWRIQAAAAGALYTLGAQRSDVRARLDVLAATHWSGVVREAAAGAARTRAGNAEGGLDAIMFNCFHRCRVDHGNPSCAGEDISDGVYAIEDGKPFRVRWNRVRRHPLPDGFPISLKQDSREDYGSSTFLRVPGGWLYGTDRWHYDGELAFVSDAGVRTALPAFGSEPAALVEIPGFGRIALGRGLFFADDAGVLSTLDQDDKGNWRVDPRIALPTVPHAWAVAPEGQLLVADPDNAVAVWPTGRIANLQCPRQTPRNRGIVPDTF